MNNEFLQRLATMMAGSAHTFDLPLPIQRRIEAYRQRRNGDPATPDDLRDTTFDEALLLCVEAGLEAAEKEAGLVGTFDGSLVPDNEERRARVRRFFDEHKMRNE